MDAKIKILKDGNRITYVLARENESIPLVVVENGAIKIEMTRISSRELAYRLATVLEFAAAELD